LAKQTWDERFEIIAKEFPDTRNFNWESAVFNDTDLFTSLLGDVIRSGRTSKRPGKRPALSRKEAEGRLNQLAAEDHSELEFQDAFRVMCGKRSIRHIANKTGLDRNMVHGLMTGKKYPTFALMEQIADAFDRDPSFFLEYRIGYILSRMNTFLFRSPDTASLWYKKFKTDVLEVSG